VASIAQDGGSIRNSLFEMVVFELSLKERSKPWKDGESECSKKKQVQIPEFGFYRIKRSPSDNA
jgi:hypothetical protein